MAALEPNTVLIYSVLAQCGPTLESCWLGVPFLNEEESHVKATVGEGIHNSPYFHVPTALLSPQGSSLCTLEAALLWWGLCPLR